MKKFLIADSGGTSTDWCFVDQENQQSHFSTESYHPTKWDAEFTERVKEFWKERPEMLEAEVYFFGAGCYRQSNADQMKMILEQAGFQHVHVRSDVHGAALATLGKEDGWGAILGTGSVMFEWKGGDIVQLVGGKGHEIGDEGSGFYFGKLVYDAFLNDELTEEQELLFRENVDEMGLAVRETPEWIKYGFAHIAKDLSGTSAFDDFHFENLKLFCSTHLTNEAIDELSFVGTYAYYQQEKLQQLLTERKVKLNSVIDKPIVQIVEQIVLSVD